MRNLIVGIALCAFIAGCAEEERSRVAQETVVEQQQSTIPGKTRVIQSQSSAPTTTRTETRVVPSFTDEPHSKVKVERPSGFTIKPVPDLSLDTSPNLKVDTPPPVPKVGEPPLTSRRAESSIRVDEEGSQSEGYVQSDERISVSGSKLTRSIQASGQDVEVQGNKNHLTFSGAVESLRVSGSDNVIKVENAKSIGIAGKNNRVTWSGEEPRISLSGTGNVVDPPLTTQDAEDVFP